MAASSPSTPTRTPPDSWSGSRTAARRRLSAPCRWSGSSTPGRCRTSSTGPRPARPPDRHGGAERRAAAWPDQRPPGSLAPSCRRRPRRRRRACGAPRPTTASVPTWGVDRPVLTPPPPSRREATVDVLHGHEVADPYRWLEDGDADEVASWVNAQNERTRAALDVRLDRRPWLERLVSLLELTISTS